MCTHQRIITNIYTHKEYYVKCGKCPACLQEKAAHRVRRIKDTQTPGYETMMVGLTYSRHTAPYIDRDEAYLFAHGKLDDLKVYRDCHFRKVRLSSDYKIGYKRIDQKVVLTSVPYQSYSAFNDTKDLAHEFNKIGVCYYPDLQRFIARLRLNLKRHYNYDKPFKTYSCSEYGSKSHRPHFHILFFYSKGDFEVLRNAIIESWPFSDLSLWPRAIEKSYRGASYVASYVNSGSDFPSFIKKYFKPKHSYSKGFGMGNPNFSLPKVLSMYKRGSLSYSVLRNKSGLPSICDVPVPAYVIHRYFPKFKAYSRISPTALHSVMRGIADFDYEQTDAVLNRHGQGLYHYSKEEFNKFSVMLNNAFQRFKLSCGSDFDYMDFDNYCDLHCKMWSLHASTVLKLHLINRDIPDNEKYDNLDFIVERKKRGLFVPEFFEKMIIKETDPNKFSSVVAVTRRFNDSFKDNIKHRKVNNTIMSKQNEEW